MKVLFVCLGNICRSPMAEGLFRQLVKESDIKVDSAGTGNWTMGQRPHQGTQKILDQLNISSKNMRARQVTPDDFIDYDYIFAMDKENYKDLLSMSKEKYHPKIHLFLDILKDPKRKEVPDPWYTGNFTETKDLITEANKLWYKQMKTQL